MTGAPCIACAFRGAPRKGTTALAPRLSTAGSGVHGWAPGGKSGGEGRPGSRVNEGQGENGSVASHSAAARGQAVGSPALGGGTEFVPKGHLIRHTGPQHPAKRGQRSFQCRSRLPSDFWRAAWGTLPAGKFFPDKSFVVNSMPEVPCTRDGVPDPDRAFLRAQERRSLPQCTCLADSWRQEVTKPLSFSPKPRTPRNQHP